jgi:hypothetical protein
VRVVAWVVGLLVVVGCHGHSDKSERDTKGRSTAVIGDNTTTTTSTVTSVPEAGVDAGSVVEIKFVTIAWTASITQSAGAAPSVGTACTVTTHAGALKSTSASHDALRVECGTKTLFDESDITDVPTRASFSLVETPLVGEVSAFTYEMKASDTGPRTGRNQLKVDTAKGTMTVFRDTIPTFRVTMTIPHKRDPRRGLPLFLANVPAFTIVSKSMLTLTSSKGPLPFGGKTCELRISPGNSKQNCMVQLECAKKIVYGGDPDPSFDTCTIRDGRPIAFSDQKPTPIDGDPALSADLDAKTVTFADEPASGAPFSAAFTLTPE